MPNHDMQCGHCNRTWNDKETPTPAARCPHEYDHHHEGEKFWNFYDWFGVCVWSQPYMNDDTPKGMRQWWDEFIRDEEYQPEVHVIHLEDFSGEEN